MNTENFSKLSEEKRNAIEKAYHAAYKKQITVNDFFVICRKVLTEDEIRFIFQTEEDATVRDTAVVVEKEEIKTEHIEDVMQYLGIDLKEEAENINRQAETGYGSTEMVDDRSMKIEILFNPRLFTSFIYKLCSQKNTSITTEGIYLVFQIMKRKILELVDRLDEVSKTRAEAALGEYNFRITNEICKQLWYLNEMEKAKLEKLMVKKEEDPKKKKIIQEREDLLIKKRQSSNVAMAAMGIEQKSWMTGDGIKCSEETSKLVPIYAPFDEKAFDNKMKGRTITMRDFFYVMERDKNYNKSIFLIQHYFK